MSRPDRSLRAVAAALADGESVDWTSAAARMSDAPDRAILDNLRTLAHIADVTSGTHRSTAALVRPSTSPPLPGWALVVVGLAALQVLAGLIGWAIGRPDPLPVSPAYLGVTALAFGGTGAFLLAASRSDERTANLGALFMTVASASAHPLSLRLLPLLPAGMLPLFAWRGLLAEPFIPLFLFRFLRSFPRVIRLGAQEGVLRAGTRIAAVVSLIAFAGQLMAAIRMPNDPPADPVFGSLAREHPDGAYWLLIITCCAGGLVLALQRARDATAAERRRAAVFLAGLVLGLMPFALIVLLDYLLPPFHRLMQTVDGRRVLAAIAYAFVLSVPLTTVYAVRAHHVMSVGRILHRSLQYAIARATLRTVAVVPVVLLLALAYAHRDAPLTQIVTGRQAIALATVALVAVMLLAGRGGLERSLDRFFGRSAQDLHNALARAGASLQAAHTPDEVLYAVTALAEESLGGQGAAWLRVTTIDGLRPVVQASRPVEAGSALLSLGRDDATVVETDPQDRRSLFRWLPEWDRQWVVDENLSLFAPVRAATGELAGALAMRGRPTEFPYSRNERLFLQTLATTAALALDRVADTPAPNRPAAALQDDAAGECTHCGLVHPRAGRRCPCGGPTEAALLPYVLHGKFRLRRRAGCGGMGLVYEADDLSLGRVVALKTLPRLSAALSLRLRAEARSMAALTHPHLALIFGAETWRGTPVLVLEYMSGGTLASRLQPPMPLSDTMAVIGTIGEALGAMHEAGYLHRDVKPSNIGLTASGEAKLLDFGLAHLLAEARPILPRAAPLEPGGREQGWSLTSTGHVVGTPLYLSPEVHAGAAPGPVQDLWALAIVLYECVTGIHPFRGAQRTRRERDWACADVRTHRPDCPSALASFLTRALARDAARRPKTAADFCAQLAALC